MLARLREYKELIAIILFFLGGFVWMERTFPKKDDLDGKVQVLQCLLDSYMRITQRQLESQEIERRIAEQLARLETGPRPAEITPAMEMQLRMIQQDVSDQRGRLADVHMDIKRIRDDLERNACGSV